MGHKRAAALERDELAAVYDVDPVRARALAGEHGAKACSDLDELLSERCDVVVVATSHDQLAPLACRALEAGSHVLVEKPAGLGTADVERVRAARDESGRLVKVGFNHRFHPAIARAVDEARSGRFGPVMFTRGLYGHGGRIGYEREWRAQRELSGGGELIDQGMHLLDLSHAVMGQLPLHSALLKTSFWDIHVEDNAVLVLAASDGRSSPWSLIHVSWTEWKNMFCLEIYCRTGKLRVDGLAGSYGPQRLRIYTMSAELGPPELEVLEYDPQDISWSAEWRHLREAIVSGDGSLQGDLDSAAYAWGCVESAYARSGWPVSGEASRR
jgi:predicted dehydrogenase